MSHKSQLDHHLYATAFELNPSAIERYLEYRWVAEQCCGLKVFDIGCNTGYGSELIAQNADSVYGVDVVRSAVDIARVQFAGVANLSFDVVPEDKFTDQTDAFDAAVALNIIEHFPDPAEKVRQMHDLLVPGGKAILTTVNRELRIYPWQKPWNDLHHIEFSPSSLQKLLLKTFSRVELWGMHYQGDFFPDYVTGASRSKFKIAFEYPVRNALRRTVRPILSKVFQNRFTAVSAQDQPLLSRKNLTVDSGITFDEACEQATVNRELENCVKILAVAYKE